MAGKPIGTIFAELDLDVKNYTKKQREIVNDAKGAALTVEKSWRIIGKQSDKMYDLMRQRINKAYDTIKNKASSTSQEIIRAEKAAKAQIKKIDEQQYGRQVSFIQKLKKHWMGLAAATYAAYKVLSGAITTMLTGGARYETLGIVMETVGHNAGYTAKQMDEFDKSLQRTGISMLESRQNLARMNQAQLDLTKATELGRVAQDAAVIGMIDSSQAFNQLIHGIQSANVRVLRNIGIMVSFEDAYKRAKAQLGGTTKAFTEAEKANIRMNAVLEVGKRIYGTYEAAMSTAGKQAYSLTRHLSNFKVLVTTPLNPVLLEVIEAITGGLVNINKSLSGETLTKLTDWGTTVRISVISVEAEVMRLAMLLDKVGGTMTSAKMLLYGPGAALGVESSTKRFEAAAEANMMYERRYTETSKALEALAKKQIDLEYSLTAEGKKAAQAAKEVAEVKILAEREVTKAKEAAAAKALELSILMTKLEKKAHLKGLALLDEAMKEEDKYIAQAAKDAQKAKEKLADEQIKSISKLYNAEVANANMMGQIAVQGQKQKEERWKVEADFNTQYAALGKSRFDIEREQLNKQAKVWEEYNFDQNKRTEMYSEKFKAIKKAEMMYATSMAAQMFANVAGTFMQIAQAGGKQSEKAFRMYQAFAIAQAIMNTAMLALAGGASLAVLPIIGPALAAAWIPTAYAMGAVQIAMIASAKPPSYDQGGISSAKGVYQTGDISEAHIPLKGGKVPVNVTGESGTTIIIKMENPVFQDVATQRQVFAQIAEVIARRVAPGAVISSYRNDGQIRQLIRGRA